MTATIDSLLADLGSGPPQPVYLVSGNPVLAEPAARRLAEAIAAAGGAQVDVVRRPGRLGDLLGDLRTFSLFAGCRVLLVIESAMLADHRAAAELVDQVLHEAPEQEASPSGEQELTRPERSAAARLLQVLRLFEIDPYDGGAGELVGRLPAWALEGAGGRGRRKRTKAAVAAARERLAALLEAARAAGLRGTAESDLAELGDILENGLPPGHALVLAESSVSSEHPLTVALAKRGALVALGDVEAGRRGDWTGIEALATQLEHQTGVGIDRPALDELARRTLHQLEPGRASRVDAESSGRFAAEYAKLAAIAGERRIDLPMVQEAVEDRGEEDVWKILDAIGEGRAAEALGRIDRLTAGAADDRAALFGLFGLLAGFCRQLTAVAGAMRATGVEPGVRSYARFKSALAPRLQADTELGPSPLKGLHPFRLHRAYLAASRIRPEALVALPWKVLETELRMKGESRDPATALARLVTELATAAA
jgi:DNA polymerase-3 subunit delta